MPNPDWKPLYTWGAAYFGLWFVLAGLVDLGPGPAHFSVALGALILTTTGILLLPKSLNNLGLLSTDQTKKLGL